MLLKNDLFYLYQPAASPLHEPCECRSHFFVRLLTEVSASTDKTFVSFAVQLPLPGVFSLSSLQLLVRLSRQPAAPVLIRPITKNTLPAPR